MISKPTVYPYHRIFTGGSAGKRRKGRRVLPEMSKTFSVRLTVEALVYLVVGVLLSRAVVLGGLTPFGTAFLAVLAVTNRRLLWLPAVGMILFGVVWQGTTGSVVDMVVLLFIALVARLKPGITGRSWVAAPLLAGGSHLLVNGILAQLSRPVLYETVSVLTGSLLAAAIALAFLQVAVLIEDSRWIEGLAPEEWACVALLPIGVLAGLMDIRLMGLSLYGVAGELVVLLVSLVSGSGAGSAAGALVGLIPSLTGQPSPSLIGVYSLCGLLAGILRRYRRLGIAAGFLIGRLLLAVYLWQQPGDVRIVLLTDAAAMAIFFLLPMERMLPYHPGIGFGSWMFRTGAMGTESLRQAAAQRIRELGRVFLDASGAVHLNEVEEPERQVVPGELIQELAFRVCRGCSLVDVCWERDLYNSYQKILEMFAAAETKGSVFPEDVPLELSRRCTRTGELAVAVTCLYETYRLDLTWQRKLNDSRRLVTTQLSGAAGLMTDLATQLQKEAGRLEELERLLGREIMRNGVQAEAFCLTGESGEHFEAVVTKKACQGEMDCAGLAAPLVSRLVGHRLAVDYVSCALQSGEKSCSFRLYPVNAFELEVGTAQVPAGNSVICGDHFVTTGVRSGKHALILSDGMGTGPRAARESAATGELLSRLLASGFNSDLAVKTVNSALVFGSTEDTFTTVDLALVDLGSGETEFVKIGAAPSYIKHGQQVSPIRSGSLPIGILQQVEAIRAVWRLQPGDCLVMVTDGVMDLRREDPEGDNWLVRALRELTGDQPQAMAEDLLSQALRQYGGLAGDDISIVVARLDRCQSY